MLTNHKELKKILKDAEEQGWAFTRGRGNHIKGKHTTGKTTTISVSPSDYRVLKNIQKDLRVG